MSGMANTATIYHNQRCNTSRTVLGLIRDAGIEPAVVKYLETRPHGTGCANFSTTPG